MRVEDLESLLSDGLLDRNVLLDQRLSASNIKDLAYKGLPLENNLLPAQRAIAQICDDLYEADRDEPEEYTVPYFARVSAPLNGVVLSWQVYMAPASVATSEEDRSSQHIELLLGGEEDLVAIDIVKNSAGVDVVSVEFDEHNLSKYFTDQKVRAGVQVAKLSKLRALQDSTYNPVKVSDAIMNFFELRN